MAAGGRQIHVLTFSATSLLRDQKFGQEVSRGSSALSEYVSDSGGALCELPTMTMES